MSTCAIEGCERRRWARGWCKLHWQRWWRKGTPEPEGLQVKGPRGSGQKGRYRIVVRHGHPLAMSRGRILEHRLVLYGVIGPGGHPCHHCGVIVRWEAERTAADVLVADHLDFDRLNNDPGNLVPSCNPCNVTRDREAA